MDELLMQTFSYYISQLDGEVLIGASINTPSGQLVAVPPVQGHAGFVESSDVRRQGNCSIPWIPDPFLWNSL